VTQQSFFPRRCARRNAFLKTNCCVSLSRSIQALFEFITLVNSFMALRHSAFGIRHSAFGIRHSAFGIRHSAFGIRHSAFGIRHLGKLVHFRFIRHFAEAKPMAPTAPKRSWWCPGRTHPRRTQCGVGADERVVTHAECASARIPDAPLPPPSQGTRLRVRGLSRFLLPSFSLRQAKKSRCPPRTGATLIDQYQIKERPTP
jgi:hypothetical protein